MLAEGGEGLKRGGVEGWGTHGPGSGVERAGGWGKNEGRGVSGCGVLGERLGQRGDGSSLREQGADVPAAEGQFSGTQAAGVGCTQRGEQEEQADEMAIAETHVFLILNELQTELDADCCLAAVSSGLHRVRSQPGVEGGGF